MRGWRDRPCLERAKGNHPVARILLTSGPTRQYLDPVRYLSNASSGRMGSCLAAAALALGHDVVIVSGPVQARYPEEATVIPVVTTEQMLEACQREFGKCDGAIGAAAPCDYRPRKIAEHKLKKSGKPLSLELIPTPDILATLGQAKRADQWLVGFALETEDARARAWEKLQRKSCDLIVLNAATAIDSPTNTIEIIAAHGEVVCQATGTKEEVAKQILEEIQARLVGRIAG